MISKVKRFIAFSCCCVGLFATPTAADINITKEINIKATELVAKRRASNLTYKQMMAGMGNAFILMQIGILSQNKKVVRDNVLKINNHPAPKDPPWEIVEDKDKLQFKESLLAFDQLLHQNATDILSVLETSDWIKINEEVFKMSNNCTSCHVLWKGN